LALLAILLAQLAGGQVVEEEERRRALHGDVVDAVVHQVRANGVVDSQLEGDLQLGPHAVCAGDKHGLGEFFQVQREQTAKSADLREHMLVECLARQHLDPLLGAVAGGDVNPGIGVGGTGLRSGLRICALCVERV